MLLGLSMSLGVLGSVLLQMGGLETGPLVPHARGEWRTERKVFRRNAAFPSTCQAVLRMVHLRMVHVICAFMPPEVVDFENRPGHGMIKYGQS